MWKNLRIKSLYQKSDLTGFKPFEEFFTFLLSISGFNILSKDVFATKRSRSVIGIVFLLPALGILSSSCVIWKYSNDLEELILGTITLIMCSQVLSKMIELFSHRKDHCEMIKIVISQTKELERDTKLCGIGILNFRRAQFYVSFASISYLAALASLNLYPFYALLFNGQFKLSANVELPGTNHKEPLGFAINYVFSTILATISCFIILG